MKTVDAVMPHRDYTEYLPETLASLGRQTHPILQIVIADDGSTDEQFAKLMEIHDNWEHPVTKLHVIRVEQDDPEKERSMRIPFARNCGYEALPGKTSDFIFFPDADDLWNVEYVEKCLEIMEDETIDFVYPNITLYQEGEMKRHLTVPNFNLERLFRQCYITCCTMMRTEAFLHAGMWPENQYKKEYVFWNTIARLGHMGRRLQGRMFYYHQHAGQRHTQYTGKVGSPNRIDKHERYNSRMYISKMFNVPIM